MSTTKRFTVILIVLIALVLQGCADTSSQNQAQQAAKQAVAEREFYIPRNDVEGANYNKRLQIADDPTSILWCTFVFPVTGLDPITVPIVGKLTSGAKRPYPTEVQTNNNSTWNPEMPGPDGMFGSSGEYRYGFTPGGVYIDFYNLPAYCTTMPTVMQMAETRVMLQIDDAMAEASAAARQALKDGDPGMAQFILESAFGQTSNEESADE